MTNVMRACAALVFCAILAQPSVAAEPVGKVLSAKTSVFSSGEEGRRTLESRDPIFFMDRLSTNGTGVGEFVFDDGTKLALGPSASLTVDRFAGTGMMIAATAAAGTVAGANAERVALARAKAKAKAIDRPLRFAVQGHGDTRL